MKKENLVAWKILSSLRRENDDMTNKKIWQKIFKKCRKELSEMEPGKNFVHYQEMEITSDDLELGSMRIMRMVMEQYNDVVKNISDRMENRMINTNQFLKSKKENQKIKKDSVSLVISNMLKKIKEDEQLQRALKKELRDVISQIESFTKKEVA